MTDFLTFPIFAIAWNNDLILVSGGGGGKKFAVLNKLVLYQAKAKLTDPLYEEDTGTELVGALEWGRENDLVLACISSDCMILKVTRECGLVRNITRLSRFTTEIGGGIVKVAKYSWDCGLIVSGGDDGVVRLWKDNVVQAECRGHKSHILSVHISSDSKLVCASSFDKSCRVWKADGTPLKTLKFNGLTETKDFIIRSCRFTREGQLLTLQTEVRGPSYVTLWSSSLLPIANIEVYKGASCLMLSAGRALAVGTNEGEVHLFKVSSSSLEFLYKKTVFDLPVTCMAFNHAETRLVAGSADYAYAYLPARRPVKGWVMAAGVVVLSWIVWLYTQT